MKPEVCMWCGDVATHADRSEGPYGWGVEYLCAPCFAEEGQAARERRAEDAEPSYDSVSVDERAKSEWSAKVGRR